MIPVTTQLIPGPPRELRISSTCTDKMLKIHWKEPSLNPQAVDKYLVQMQKSCKKALHDLDIIATKLIIVTNNLLRYVIWKLTPSIALE